MAMAGGTAQLLCWGCALMLVARLHAAHLPAEYPLCKQDGPDVNDCMKNALQAVLNMLPGGIPSLGVVPIDPLKVPLIEISDGTKNLNLKMTFRNVTVTGLSKGLVNTASLDLAKNVLEFSGLEPLLVFEADYEMKGKFLVVPVEGSGRCKFIFTNLGSDLKVVAERKKKGSVEHWEVTDFPLSIQRLDRLQVNFENLFNGDQTLGPGFNRLLNENWIEFWGALRPTFEESFGLIFKSFAVIVFGKVPLDEAFPPK